MINIAVFLCHQLPPGMQRTPWLPQQKTTVMISATLDQCKYGYVYLTQWNLNEVAAKWQKTFPNALTNRNFFSKFYSSLYQKVDLILSVRGPSYLGLTRSISWSLMPWLLASPGHQQPWYWLCKISKSWSYTRKDFNYLRHVSVEEWHKM